MDHSIVQARAILDLVRKDACLYCGSKDPLSDQCMAQLTKETLSHVGISASAVYTQLNATRHDSIKFSMDIAAVDLHLQSGLVRMNLLGDIGDAVIPGIVQEWEQRCKRIYPGAPVPSVWRVVDAKHLTKNRPADYFANRAGNLLAQAQVASLGGDTAQVSQPSRPGPRL